ncbi:putative transmembrane protein, heat domain [Paenarthrobacter aurescens TC1]|uniref:Transmembrane protein, heat domain n=1 Tax=Paenarthrobacter aurescens (strain TC1) TaxID=290340 RepID=A1R4E7_PAEAT|nr:putative transmembrane protein, heat domain [Paenarthrobacter aurescens TC1]
MRKPNIDPAGLAAVSASLTAFQLGNGVAVGLIETVGAGTATCLRVGIGALVLLPALWLARYSAAVSARYIVAYGVVLGLMQLCFYQAISHIPLSLAVSVEFVVPLVVGCLRSRSWAVRLAAFGAVAGLFLIADYDGPTGPAGVLWAVATGMLLSIYIRVGTAMPAVCHPLGVLSRALWVAFLVILAGQFLAPAPDLHTAAPLAGQALVVALLTIVFPFSLELFAMKRLRALPFTMVSALDPALASAVGVLGLNQFLDGRQVTGLIVLTGCAALTVWADTRAQSNNQLNPENQGAEDEIQPIAV